MKVFPKRTNETAVRCMLEGAELKALLAEAAAKAAGFDLSAHNVKVESVKVEGPDYSQHRREPSVIVDLVMIHDPEALSHWVAEHEPVKAAPPEPPPMRCVAQKRRPFLNGWAPALCVPAIFFAMLLWCLGVLP